MVACRVDNAGMGWDISLYAQVQHARMAWAQTSVVMKNNLQIIHGVCMVLTTHLDKFWMLYPQKSDMGNCFMID